MKGVSIVLWMLALTFCGIANAQTNFSTTVRVGEAEQAKTQPFDVTAGQAVAFTLVSAASASTHVNIYVYNASGTLVWRDDPDNASSALRFVARSDGAYYGVLDNTGKGDVTVRIAPEKVRTTVDPTVGHTAATVRIYFATDRKVDPSSKQLSFLPDPAVTTYGVSEVTIPRDHRLGELEGPSIFRLEFRPDPVEHVAIHSLESDSERMFVRRVKSKLNSSRNKEILIFVHGFNVSFEDAIRRTAQISYDLAFDGPAVTFSWPSQGGVSPLAYTRDQRNADLSSASLASVLRTLSAAGAHRVNIIAHSMGNRVLAAALQELTRTHSGMQLSLNEVAMLAPDIDAELFKRFAKEFSASARRITLYASSRDGALALSRRVAGYRRAGQAGDQILVIPEAQTIDASAVDTSLLGLNHSYFADNSTILSDLFATIRGKAPEDRFGLQVITVPEGRFWRFLPAAR